MPGVLEEYPAYVLFLNSHEGDHSLNRMTAYLGKQMHGEGFCHVEICIPDIPGVTSFSNIHPNAMHNNNNMSSSSSQQPQSEQQLFSGISMTQKMAKMMTMHGNNKNTNVPSLSLPHLSSSETAKGGGYVSASIYNGETVTIRKQKTFANPGYVVHTLSLTKEQLRAMADYLYDLQRQQVGFDGMGMYLAILPFQLRFWGSPSNKTFCSRLVIEALRCTGAVDGIQSINANITTPSKLYSLLKRDAAQNQRMGIIGTVPYKQKAMLDNIIMGRTQQQHQYRRI